MNLGYSIPIVFEKPLRKTGANISLIPYIATGNSQDFVNRNNPNNGTRFNVGGDAKIAVTSGLNLDLTVNPDSVSYTHLDVYKRQNQKPWKRKSSAPVISSCCPASDTTLILRSRDGMAASFGVSIKQGTPLTSCLLYTSRCV